MRCTLPITQIELANITALTPVHVNRVLMQLKREKLAFFKNGVLQVPDLTALSSQAALDPQYLFPQSACMSHTASAIPQHTSRQDFTAAQSQPSFGVTREL